MLSLTDSPNNARTRLLQRGGLQRRSHNHANSCPETGIVQNAPPKLVEARGGLVSLVYADRKGRNTVGRQRKLTDSDSY